MPAKTTNAALQQKLDELAAFAAQNNIKSFVEAFVPLDCSPEDTANYLSVLTGDDDEWAALSSEIQAIADGATIEAHFWRHASHHKVWYEWALVQPQLSPIHNVNGRSTYAEGVADACLFLAAKADAGFPRSRFLGLRKRLFDMIDVLQEGAMS